MNAYVLFCIALACVVVQCTAAEPADCAKLIHVNVNGTDSPTCLQGNGSCETLHYAFTNCTITNSTQFLIGPGTFSLTQDLGTIHDTPLSGLEGLVVKGSGAEETIVDCSNASGLAFVNMTNLTISDLTLFNCSQSRPSTSIGNVSEPHTVPFEVGLYIWRCRDVVIENVYINETIGVGLVLYETVGRVSINSSVFHHNGIPENMTDTLYGGGGVNIEFPYCPPGHYDDDECGKELSGAEYLINNCSFTENTARIISQYDTQFITPNRSIHQTFGRGGGMAIFFSGNSSNNVINVTDCKFLNNQASFGGGLFCEFHDRAQNNTFSVHISFFQNNTCYNNTNADGGGGGGVRIAFLSYTEVDSIAGNEIYIGQSNFVKNTALFGGGVSFLTGREQNVFDASNQLEMDTCTFVGNVARVGSAVCLLPWSLVSSGVHPIVTIRDCIFFGNSVDYDHNDLFMMGMGTFYSYGVQFDVDKSCIFDSNKGSAIVVVGTGANFKQNTSGIFRYNFARDGGGIAAFASGWVTLYDGSELSFKYNKAAGKGGAVYSESSGGHQILASRDCMFRYYEWWKSAAEWDCKLHFVNNIASNGGSDIYVSSVYPCMWGSSGGSVNDSLSARESVFRPPVWKAFKYDDGNGSIWTAASKILSRGGKISVSTFPGQLINLNAHHNFDPVDDFNNPVTVPFYASVKVSNVTEERIPIQVSSDYTYTVRDISLVKEKGIEEEVRREVELRTLFDPVMVFHFNATITSCPPGTTKVTSSTDSPIPLSSGDNTVLYDRCDCSSGSSSPGYLRGIICYNDGNKIELFRNNHYWVGYIGPPHHQLVSGDCPYCNVSESSVSRNVPLNLTNPVEGTCRSFHEGVLCGNCTYGVILTSVAPTFECGSEKCRESSSAGAWMLWFTLQLFLSTLVIAIVLLLDFNVVGGALCSFVFFNQVALSLNLQYCACDEHGIFQYLLIPYEFWSLQFGQLVPHSWSHLFCVSELHYPMQVLALDYIFAFYPFLLVILIWVLGYCQDRGWCCRCCHNLCVKVNLFFYRLRQLLAQRTSLVHGIATCLVLTYGKLATISLHILTPGPLNLPTGNNAIKTGLTRAYFSGDWIFFGYPHAYFGVLAIAVLLTGVILPPLFLFSYPVLPQVATKCSSRLGDKLNRFYNRRFVFHLLTIFQGHYKARYHFYAGMWFVYRLLLYFNDAFNIEYYLLYFVQILCGVSFLLIHALMQPCQQKKHFVIDCLLFTNIIVLSCLAHLAGHTDEQPELYPELYVAAIAILLIVPYIFFFGVIAYRIVQKVRERFCNKGRGQGERRRLLGSGSSQQTSDNESIPTLVRAGGGGDDDDFGGGSGGDGGWFREGLNDSAPSSKPSDHGDEGQDSKQDGTPLVSSITVEVGPVHAQPR